MNSPESISRQVADDLGDKGWSLIPTGIDPEDRAAVHDLFQTMNGFVASDRSVRPETTTLAPRDDSRVLATTREAMSFHTDNVYLDDPCRSVALFCTVQAPEGGGNTLVDGIATARTLPDDVIEALKRPEWRWLNPIVDGPSGEYAVLNEAEDGLRWWRMSLIAKDMAQSAIADVFQDALLRSQAGTSVLMRPGDLLTTDNTRVVHDRKAFKGSRHLYRARFW